MGKNLLTPNQLRLLESVAKDPKLTSSFFFTGGTALSHFYLQHRFSEDLDFFSEQELDPIIIQNWVKKTADELSATEVKQHTLASQEIFYFHFKDQIVKVDFAYFPFPHLGTFSKFKQLRVSSLEDIATNKVQAITTRKRARDYLDLYLAAKKLGWQTKDMQQHYQLKFDVRLEPEELATSFTNVLDATDQPIFLGDTSMQETKNYFLEEVKKLKGEILEK